MITIRFPDVNAEHLALKRLAGRFNFQTWACGEMLVPEEALPFLTEQGVAYFIEGMAGRSSSNSRSWC